jgi:hypothetical protein
MRWSLVLGWSPAWPRTSPRCCCATTATASDTHTHTHTHTLYTRHPPSTTTTTPHQPHAGSLGEAERAALQALTTWLSHHRSLPGDAFDAEAAGGDMEAQGLMAAFTNSCRLSLVRSCRGGAGACVPWQKQRASVRGSGAVV